jgi:Ni,Fe-hydrogenase maturation factor
LFQFRWQIPASDFTDEHQIKEAPLTIRDLLCFTIMLFAAKLKDLYPENVVLWGIQPGTLEVGLDLSPTVAAQVDVLVEKVVEELARWGDHITLRNDIVWEKNN